MVITHKKKILGHHKIQSFVNLSTTEAKFVVASACVICQAVFFCKQVSSTYNTEIHLRGWYLPIDICQAILLKSIFEEVHFEQQGPTHKCKVSLSKGHHRGWSN